MKDTGDLLNEIKELDHTDSLIDDVLYSINVQKESIDALENYVKDLKDIIQNCCRNLYDIVNNLED